MKINIFILFIFLSQLQIHAQSHDNVWTFGYTNMPCDSTSDFGGTNVHFIDGEINSEFVCRTFQFGSNTNSSISDKTGELKLMFNGCQLSDANDNSVEGGETLVRNDTNIEQTWWCLDGYNTPHSSIFIPDPYEERQYYLFYRDIKALDEQPYAYSDSLFMGIIAYEDGTPYVLDKVSVVSDTISLVGTAAVRHANGIDWWVVVKNAHDKAYHVMLINEAGVNLHHTQTIGSVGVAINGGNTIKFSPDGRYFATIYPFGNLDIFTFDRGIGMFEEYITIPFWADAQANLVNDLEFSPSSDLLYIAETDTMWQFDMTVGADEFFGSKTTVGVRDSFADPFPNNFWLMQTAPDGKIYMSARNSNQFMHVIHSPDEKGVDCDFRQHDYKLPTKNAFGMPYFPNYRLGADPNWVSTEDVPSIDISIYPNPSTGQFTVNSELDISLVALYDTNGRLLFTSSELTNDVSYLPPAVYIVKVTNAQRHVFTEKLVMIR